MGKSFFTSFVQSTYNIAWLKERKNDLGKAVSYAILFLLAISVIRDFPILWQLPRVFRDVQHTFVQTVPDFRAEWKGGELEVTNLQQPYIYRMGDGKEAFVLAVDTVSTSTVALEDVVKESPAQGLLITRTGMRIYDAKQGQERVQLWKDVPNTVFTKEQAVTFVNKFTGTFGYLIAPLIIFFIFVATVIGKFVYLLLVALVVKVVTLFTKVRPTFKEIYTVGLFAITVPTLLQMLGYWTRFDVPFLYTVVLLGYLLFTFFSKKGNVLVNEPPVTQ